MIGRVVCRFSALAALFLACSPLHARAADNATVAVSANVQSVCKVTQAPGQTLSLTNTVGGIDPTLATDATGSATITYKCTTGQSPGFTFVGTNDTAGFHRVVSGANALVYTVSSVSGGAGTGFGGGAEKTLTVSGTINSVQYGAAVAGTYADTLTISVTP